MCNGLLIKQDGAFLLARLLPRCPIKPSCLSPPPSESLYLLIISLSCSPSFSFPSLAHCSRPCCHRSPCPPLSLLCLLSFIPPFPPRTASVLSCLRPHLFFCPLLLASFSPSGSSVQSVPLLPPPLLLLTSLSVCIAIVLQRLQRRRLFAIF